MIFFLFMNTERIVWLIGLSTPHQLHAPNENTANLPSTISTLIGGTTFPSPVADAVALAGGVAAALPVGVGRDARLLVLGTGVAGVPSARGDIGGVEPLRSTADVLLDGLGTDTVSGEITCTPADTIACRLAGGPSLHGEPDDARHTLVRPAAVDGPGSPSPSGVSGNVRGGSGLRCVADDCGLLGVSDRTLSPDARRDELRWPGKIKGPFSRSMGAPDGVPAFPFFGRGWKNIAAG